MLADMVTLVEVEPERWRGPSDDGDPPQRRAGTTERGRNCRARATPFAPHIQVLEFQPCHAGAVDGKFRERSEYEDRTMTEVLITTDDRPKPTRGNGAAHAAVLVSGYELARHFGCSRQNVDLLAQQGVIERRAADGLFDQDVSRLKYLTHLRSEHRRSPRAAADAEFALAKAELIRLRVAERKRDLIPREEASADMEHLIGLFLTGLSGFAAQFAGRDLAMRRVVDKGVYDLRLRISLHQAGGSARRTSSGCRTMIGAKMTDSEVRQQVERADRFAADFRKLVAATVVDPASPCADYHRRGLRRIADTVGAVPYVTMCNLSNLNTALRGGLLSLIEVQLMCVGGGPTLDYADATAFLAGFEPLIEKARSRMLQ